MIFFHNNNADLDICQIEKFHVGLFQTNTTESSCFLIKQNTLHQPACQFWPGKNLEKTNKAFIHLFLLLLQSLLLY